MGDKISMKKIMAFQEAADYLADLHKHFKDGKIVIVQDGEHVTMTPPEQVTVEIEAKQKKGKKKFALEVSWVESESGELSITDKEPEKPEEDEDEKEEESKDEKAEAAKPATAPAADKPAAAAAAAAKPAAAAANAAADKAKETATAAAKKPAAAAKPAAPAAKKGPGAK